MARIRIFLYFSMLAIMFPCGGAFASCYWSEEPISEHCQMQNTINCLVGADLCDKYTNERGLFAAYQSCNICEKGYVHEERFVSFPEGCENYTYTICVKEKEPCTNTCPAATEWTSMKLSGFLYAGVQMRTKYQLNQTSCECEAVYEYRCAQGYYYNGRVSSTSNIPKCSLCPTLGGAFGTTNPPNGDVVHTIKSSIKDCYIPMNTDVTDEIGTYTYDDNCGYQSELPQIN